MWPPARMVNGCTFRSHAGSEPHALIESAVGAHFLNSAAIGTVIEVRYRLNGNLKGDFVPVAGGVVVAILTDIRLSMAARYATRPAALLSASMRTRFPITFGTA
jgi:hypothetical protein